MTVPGLLALLTACGAHVAAHGDALALTGKRPPAPLLEALSARKADVLAYLQEPAKEDPASSPDVAPWEDLPATPARPDWAVIAAQPGRCGSCARAVAAPDWGPLMVTCSCDPAAWWPLPAPWALHVGARCGAYLKDGETVGRGYRGAAL